MGLRKDKGIPPNGNAKLKVSLKLSVGEGKKEVDLASIDCWTALPYLLKKTHLKNAERLFVNHLQNTAIGQFKTEVLCLIKELMEEELASSDEEAVTERLPLEEEGGSPGD